MDHPSALVPYYRDADVHQSKADSTAVIEYVRSLDPTGQRIAPILTPRSAASCTSEQLAMIRDMANDPTYPLRIQTHLSENVSELVLVQEMWPSHKDYTAVYDAHGLLTPRTILAHAIHLAESERDVIAARGAKVSHCPVSNSALASGMCRVRQLMNHGIVVGLGSDVSGGYSPSILEAARHACLVSRLLSAQFEQKQSVSGMSEGEEVAEESVPKLDNERLTVEEALWLATRGGADVVGWKDRLGAFEVGMQFDAQLVAFDALDSEHEPSRDLGNYKVFGWESWDDRLAKWVYCGDDRNTSRVWVGGRLVHQRTS